MTGPKYFDVHSHVTFHNYDADRDAVVTRMEEEDVWTLTVGVDLKTSQDAVLFCADRKGFFATIGVHPNDTPEKSFNAAEFEKLVSHPKVVGVGECGIDYFRIQGDIQEEKKRQWREFEVQMEFATIHDKPLMVHCRPSKGSMDAYEDMLKALGSKFREVGERLRGNMHFFVGRPEVAKRFYEIGFSTSFTGVLTFTHDYDETVRQAPLDLILTETDAPYAAPTPYRGQRNEPVYVRQVVERIAELRNEPVKVISEAVVMNARRLFGV